MLLPEGKQRFSPFYHDLSLCVLFDITSEHSAELKWLMLNKHKRWFHSSHVKFPLVGMSASCFLVSMYLIWILVSKLNWSNNKSRATLWFLETCLIAGLLSFLSAWSLLRCPKTHTTKLFDAKIGTFEGTRSTLFKTLNIPRDCWPCAWLASRQTTGVSRSIMFNSFFMKRTCFDLLGTGTFLLHLARDLRDSKQRVSPFYYHDLGLDLVVFDWELLDCWTTCPSRRSATSEPNSFIQSCFKEIFERRTRVTHILSRIWLLQFPS